MRIVIENIPLEKASEVLAQLEGLGFAAFGEQEPAVDAHEQEILDQIEADEKEPEMSKTFTVEETFARYDARTRV